MSEPAVFAYLREMRDRSASDLYLTVEQNPILRIDDHMIPIGDKKLDAKDINEILSSVLTSRQKREYSEFLELNTALDMGDYGRFRINVLQQRQAPALVIRRVVSRIPSFKELNLPSILQELSTMSRGLILVSGMTGSGKSTTLASMINYRNENCEGHIITIEDPIEYYHEHKKSIVSQREVGVDTVSFESAMVNALRQRPDVILVGEIRERAVMEQALMMSETGHLCLGTIHTNNAYQAIERIVNFFPDDAHSQVRVNLALNLKAIVSQRLLPNTSGGLSPAIEIMLNQGSIKELIMKGQIDRIGEVMEQSRSMGMSTFDQSILDLYIEGKITQETVIKAADRPSDIKVKLQQVHLSGQGKDADKVLQSLDTSRMSLKE